MIGVYSFRNKCDQKRYIGKSTNIERRFKAHINEAKKLDDYFHRAIKKHGIEAFDFQILIECPKENLNYWEKFYIRYYCSNDRRFGYNMTEGGDGVLGWDDEMKQRHSDIHKGQESPMKNKNHKEETKELLRQKNLGKKQSKETIEKRINTMRENGTLGQGMKGKEPWNKGLTKENDERLKKMAESLSNMYTGCTPWNKGLSGYTIKKSGPRTPEQCENIRNGRWGIKEKKYENEE